MKTLILLLHLASYTSPLGPQPKDPGRPMTAGTSTLVIAACYPGETITIGPGNFRAYVPEDGTVVMKVPAQSQDDDPYQVQDRRGSHRLNGTATAGQMLTGVCL